MDVLADWFTGPRLLFSAPLLFALVVWCLSFVGLFSFHAFDLDLDLDHDLHLDADLDHDADFGNVGNLAQLVGLGMVPFSLFITLLLFWFGALGLGVHALYGITNWFIVGVVALPVLLVAARITGFTARRLQPLFRDFGQATQGHELIGKIATLTSGQLSTTFGQARVQLEGGVVVQVAVRADADPTTAVQGDRLVITDYLPEKNIYLATRLDDELAENSAS